jgi:hypothetical protein
MRDQWLEDRIAMTKKYGWSAIAGAFLFVFGFVYRENYKTAPLFLIGAIMVFPFLVHETLFPVWHWKRRYRGEHSDLWGALLVMETSGFCKIIYWFRHILPDWRGTGRYSP